MPSTRAIELAAWIGGALLLTTYAGIRTWSAQASDDAVEAMQAAREQRAILVAQRDGVTAAPMSPARQNPLTVSQPDTSTWNKKRLAEYEALLADKAIPEAVLRIPSLELEVPVYEGTSDETLNRGAGRIAGTAAVDSSSGNVGIAAHRDGFFRPLKDIKVGDRMFMDTIDATREYRVTQLTIVEPSNVSVLEPTSVPMITLVTCYPFYYVGSAPQRFIVHAQETSGPGTRD